MDNRKTPFNLDIDEDGAATLCWDLPGARMNIMSFDDFRHLETLFDQALGNPVVKCIILTSGKDSFAGGMDINELAKLNEERDDDRAHRIFSTIMEVHRVLRRIEREGAERGIPVIAALPGTAVGIGYELALACHRIICADNATAVIGLPEVKIGLFPGAGGTTRLVRRMGALAALPFLLRGRTLPPQDALASGLIDEVVPPDQLFSAAKDWGLANTAGAFDKPWDREGYRIPGGAPYEAKGYLDFVGIAASVSGATQGALPAARSLIQAIYEGALVPFDTALRVEARWFTQLLLDPSPSATMRSIFIDKKSLDRRARESSGEIGRLAVIGAGMMGSGIALVAAQSGLAVELIDRTQEAAQGGCTSARQVLETGVRRGRMSSDAADAIIERIRPTDRIDRVADCDLVIEAVFEDAEVKAGVLRQASDASGEHCIIASNTSTLPIGGLAAHVKDPSRFLGLHFFSPVHRMPLLEIIRGAQTGNAIIQTALHFASRIGKTPIVVRDSRFFYTNRCVVPYLNEAIRMVGEGIAAPLIENAARRLGLPVGPLQLVDETSLSLASDIGTATRAALGDAYLDQDVDAVLSIMLGQHRTGRKGKAGFYAYDESGRRQGLWAGLNDHFPLANNQPPLADVQDRLLLIQVIEAIKTLEEQVLTDARDGDVGALLGWGFPPWTGGPFSWIDMIGASNAAERCRALASRRGPRFAPPPSLIKKKDEQALYRG